MAHIVDPVLESCAEAHTTPPPAHLVAVAERTRRSLSVPVTIVRRAD